jgi:hypothetical protein
MWFKWPVATLEKHLASCYLLSYAILAPAGLYNSKLWSKMKVHLTSPLVLLYSRAVLLGKETEHVYF